MIPHTDDEHSGRNLCSPFFIERIYILYILDIQKHQNSDSVLDTTEPSKNGTAHKIVTLYTLRTGIAFLNYFIALNAVY